MFDERESASTATEKQAGDRPVLLASIRDGLEAGMVESLLNEHGIPVLRKYPQTGQVLHLIMGTSLYGTELHVPADRFDEAYALLEGIGVFAAPDDTDGVGEAEPEEWRAEAADASGPDKTDGEEP